MGNPRRKPIAEFTEDRRVPRNAVVSGVVQALVDKGKNRSAAVA